jgi:ribosomal protein S19
MTRSSWKLPYISLLFFQNKLFNKPSLNLRLRNSLIPINIINKKIKICIFNGIWYISIQLKDSMLNCKFGEFSFTKRSDTQTHLKKKVKKKPKGKK